jgi:hypothetical protein
MSTSDVRALDIRVGPWREPVDGLDERCFRGLVRGKLAEGWI